MIEKSSFLNEKVKSVIWRVVLDYRKKRENNLSKEGLKKEALRDELFQIKKRALSNIDQLKEKTILSLKENNIEVFEVKNALEAREKIKEIIGNREIIIQSKSNTLKEIIDDDFLNDKEVVLTDLGDFLISLFGQKEIHPVLPALHLEIEDIVQRINEKFGQKIEPEAEKIAEWVRNFLREKIVRAQVGISGANVITSDGHILILENEGNISLVSRLPPIHIIVAGFEKIVENLEDGLKIVKASALWGTGQNFPVYLSVISGPSKTADIQNKTIIGAQGAKKVFLILLDNGRSQIIKNGFEELLYCINCGACLNFCPVFLQIGMNYGDKYLGSKGVIFSGLTEGLERGVKANCFACTLCSACFYNCPVKINLPELMKKFRSLLENKNLQTNENKEMIEKIRMYGNPFGKSEEGKIPKKLYCC